MKYFCNAEQKQVEGPPRWVQPIVDLHTNEVIRGPDAELLAEQVLRPIVSEEGFGHHPNYWRYHRRMTYDPICRHCGGLLSLSDTPEE